jgi:hypothetical protein
MRSVRRRPVPLLGAAHELADAVYGQIPPPPYSYPSRHYYRCCPWGVYGVLI